MKGYNMEKIQESKILRGLKAIKPEELTKRFFGLDDTEDDRIICYIPVHSLDYIPMTHNENFSISFLQPHPIGEFEVMEFWKSKNWLWSPNWTEMNSVVVVQAVNWPDYVDITAYVLRYIRSCVLECSGPRDHEDKIWNAMVFAAKLAMVVKNLDSYKKFWLSMFIGDSPGVSAKANKTISMIFQQDTGLNVGLAHYMHPDYLQQQLDALIKETL